MFGVSKIHIFAIQECIKLIKSDSNDICIVNKSSLSSKSYSFSFSSKDP